MSSIEGLNIICVARSVACDTHALPHSRELRANKRSLRVRADKGPRSLGESLGEQPEEYQPTYHTMPVLHPAPQLLSQSPLISQPPLSPCSRGVNFRAVTENSRLVDVAVHNFLFQPVISSCVFSRQVKFRPKLISNERNSIGVKIKDNTRGAGSFFSFVGNATPNYRVI